MTLQVKAGEFTAVIGKSGSGKSTMINMITGIDRPTLGEVIINGTAIQNLNEDQMAAWRSLNLGVVFQFFQMLPTLTLIENVQLPMLIGKRFPRAEHPQRAMHLLDLVGLADQADKFPSEVSGGQQQRAAIARSLANDPKILVADEPTGSLDSKTGDAIFRLFEDFVSEGRTILMVTHDRSLAGRVSRVIFISDGEIVDEMLADALPGLSAKNQVQILSQLESERYAPGEVIIRQGDPAETFYIITRGEADVVAQYPGGEEIVLARLSAGQYFGEMGIIEKSPRSATVRATPDADVTVMQLDREIFAQVMHESNLTNEEMAHVVRQRAIEADLQRSLPTLSKELVADVSAELAIKSYSPGKVVVRQGDPADAFYIITRGDLEVVLENPDGREQIVERLSVGEYFGEMGLLENGVRTATVRAAPDSEVTVMQLDGDVFAQVMSSSNLTRDDMAEVVRRRALENELQQALPTLDASLVTELAKRLEIISWHPGQVIARQGEHLQSFYIIAAGEVEVIEDLPDGSTAVVERLGKAQFVGEISLIQNEPEPRTVRVSATGDAKVIAIGQPDFEAMMAQSTETRQAIMRILEQRQTKETG